MRTHLEQTFHARYISWLSAESSHPKTMNFKFIFGIDNLDKFLKNVSVQDVLVGFLLCKQCATFLNYFAAFCC